jgi:hypothetical protein
MATNNSDAASEPPASATAPGALDVIAPLPVKRKASDPCDGRQLLSRWLGLRRLRMRRSRARRVERNRPRAAPRREQPVEASTPPPGVSAGRRPGPHKPHWEAWQRPASVLGTRVSTSKAGGRGRTDRPAASRSTARETGGNTHGGLGCEGCGGTSGDSRSQQGTRPSCSRKRMAAASRGYPLRCSPEGLDAMTAPIDAYDRIRLHLEDLDAALQAATGLHQLLQFRRDCTRRGLAPHDRVPERALRGVVVAGTRVSVHLGVTGWR